MAKESVPPSDYCIITASRTNRLSHFERLTLIGGEELDRAMGWLAKQFASFSYDPNIGQFDADLIKHAHQFYFGNQGWRENPAGFFVPPPTAPQVKVQPIHGLRDGEILDLEFDSSYRIQNPDYHEHPANRKVYARMWRHRQQAKATLIAIHGWTMGDQRVNSLAFLPGVFYRLGMDVVLVELPYHGRRAVKVNNKEVSLFPSNDIVLTNEVMGQIISDLRELKLYLEGTGAANIGAMGMSLGGYTAALWASLDPLAFCVPLVPLASMGDLAWEILSKQTALPAERLAKLSKQVLEEVFYLHSPLSHHLKIPPERVLIIAGVGDEIVPPSHSKMLAAHWGGAKVLWFLGGHVAQLKHSNTFQEMVEFLQALGFANHSAPTDKAP